jgi:hypothetical protein
MKLPHTAVWIDEISSRHMVYCHLNRKSRMRLNIAVVRRENECGRWHITSGSDDTHRSRVARPALKTQQDECTG